jgi:hypothetical protein
MQRAFSLLTLLAGGLLATSAIAQQAPTTVQLPTFSFFTVSTSVSVPDRGGAYLGGINRARDGSVTRGFGPLANRGIGGDRVASGMSVHATIIDLAEMDEMILAEAAALRKPVDPTVAKAEHLSRHVGHSGATTGPASSAPPTSSVAAIRQANAAAAETRSSEAAEFLAKAGEAEAGGKPAIAKIYYQMVVRRDGGELKQLAQARLAALAGGKSAAVAQR